MKALTEEVVDLLQKLWHDDSKFQILKVLCEGECSARGVARRIGMSHTMVNKYLRDMVKVGVVDVLELNSRIKVYKLNENYRWLKRLIKP